MAVVVDQYLGHQQSCRSTFFAYAKLQSLVLAESAMQGLTSVSLFHHWLASSAQLYRFPFEMLLGQVAISLTLLEVSMQLALG